MCETSCGGGRDPASLLQQSYQQLLLLLILLPILLLLTLLLILILLLLIRVLLLLILLLILIQVLLILLLLLLLLLILILRSVRNPFCLTVGVVWISYLLEVQYSTVVLQQLLIRQTLCRIHRDYLSSTVLLVRTTDRADPPMEQQQSQ